MSKVILKVKSPVLAEIMECLLFAGCCGLWEAFVVCDLVSLSTGGSQTDSLAALSECRHPMGAGGASA